MPTDRAGGAGGSWRLPPDETLQVADPKQKDEQQNDRNNKKLNITEIFRPIILLLDAFERICLHRRVITGRALFFHY